MGKRFKSALVVRVADTIPVQLWHHAPADGRWRIYVSTDSAVPQQGTGEGAPSATELLAEWTIKSPESPLAVTPSGAESDAWFDVNVIYQQEHHNINIGTVRQYSSLKSGLSSSPTTKRIIPPVRRRTFSTCAAWTAAVPL